MSMLDGLFGGGVKHSNLERLTQALHDRLGLACAVPPADVLAVIDQMTTRELLHYDNMQSVEGMQELFRAKSIHAAVDHATLSVSLSLASAAAIETVLQTEHAQRRVLHVAGHHATQRIVKPQEPASAIPAATAAPPKPAEPPAPLPPGLEHLEAFEQIRPQIIDLFVRHGRLNTGDKDVLKAIRPIDSRLESRIAALERWHDEVTRRVRGMRAPKATQRLTLGGPTEGQEEKPDEALARRFDELLTWLSKLLKAFEHSGVKFHDKPMWLPH
jgi:hypothetical protein